MRAEVVSAWQAATGNTPKTGNKPLLTEEYDIHTWSDVTGQHGLNIPTLPNEVTLHIENIPEEVMAAIEKDVDYTVLWSEDEEDA